MTRAGMQTRRFIGLVSPALMVVTSLLLGGCGGKGTDADDVVADYLKALDAGDAVAACGMVSHVDPYANYARKCEPPDFKALAISGWDGRATGPFTFVVDFNVEHARVQIRSPDGERLAQVMSVVEDGEWRIVGDAAKLDQRIDRQTLRLVERIEHAMEVFARSKPEGYTGVELEDLAKLDPRLTSVDVTVGETSPYVYVLTLRAETGHSFSIVRDSDGVKRYPCFPKGFGKCRETGYWRETYFPPGFDPDKATAQDYPPGFDPDEGR